MQKFPGLLRSDVVQSLENLLRRVLISENIPVEHLEYWLRNIPSTTLTVSYLGKDYDLAATIIAPDIAREMDWQDTSVKKSNTSELFVSKEIWSAFVRSGKTRILHLSRWSFISSGRSFSREKLPTTFSSKCPRTLVGLGNTFNLEAGDVLAPASY